SSSTAAASASPAGSGGSAATPGAMSGETPWYVDKAPGPPQSGGMLNYLLYEDPDSLNPLIGQTSIAVQVSTAILEPLAETLPDGSWSPRLAAEIPTQDNGGISADLKTVTWKLRPNVLWHDGQPFTSDDVKFTWEAATNTAGGSAVASTYEKIAGIETPDDLTVVVTYNEFNVAFVDQFPWILPRHATGDVANMKDWKFNRAPVGTGPFKFQEWQAADHVTTVKNDKYWQEGKPYLDGINFLVVPSEESRVARMLQGDAQVMLWPGDDTDAQFEKSDKAKIRSAPGIWVLQVHFNLSKPFDNDPGPTPPHPILGDIRVRQAIAMGIDRERITKQVLTNVASIDSVLDVGWIKAKVKPFEYDPEGAKKLLEEAGWVDNGGTRVAKGAKYAPDGTKLELAMNGYTSFKPIELGELAIQEDLGKLGFKITTQNQDFAIIFGTWADKAPRLLGDFDTLFYDSGFFIEPQDSIRARFHPSQVPSAENPSGANIYRWVREDVGKWIDEAGATPDREKRRAAYQKVAEAMREDIPNLPVAQFGEGSAYATNMHGFAVSTWEYSTWDAMNWWLES
ncbi:MAG TPA: peptide ABC transporter substrate-binding protein, partial [Nitrolancea sp.]|nr:peptide ABC transporter substrate-binding protein [Nitrolancea sp.]